MSRRRTVAVPGRPRLILASASPRRRRLLRQAGYRFRVDPAHLREGRPRGDAARFAAAAAQAKARRAAGRARFPAWILAADTLVLASPGRAFGKPGTAREAARMLRALAGRQHQVLTAVVLQHVPDGRKITWLERTRVTLRPVTAAEQKRYLASGEWRGKAGGYGIQGRAGAFVTRIGGCYFNVVGLPLGSIGAQLSRLGIFPE